MEEIKNMEQPITSGGGPVAEAKIEDSPENHIIGSIDSKFKDSQALSEAYDALQKEFTKKCQILSSLQKEYADNKQTTSSLPVYLKEDWAQKVESFMQKNPQAQEFSDKISRVILSDKTIAGGDDPLEKAWIKVLKENYKSPQNLLEDETFVNEHILKNKEIKAKIIKTYIDNLENESAPMLISNHSGTSAMLTPPIKPKSLEEANEIARSLLKN